MSSTPRRKNGLSAPHSYMQISTWVFLPTLVIEFLLVCSPNLPLAASIPVTLIFCALSFLAAIYGYLATVTDSVDTHLACHLRDQGEPSPPPPSGCLALFTTTSDFTPAQLRAESTKYCWVCETNVAQHSMHCKYCNKCVSKFDHHCQWLNTCVGEKNYPYFYKTLWFIASLLIVHGGTSVAIGIDILAHGATELRADNWLGGSGLKILVVAVCFFFFLLDMVALSLIAQLLLFHISLRRERLTTYQFILKDNQRKRDLTKVTDAKKAQRIVAIGTAKREGKTMLVYQLQCGQHCKTCDPLVVEDATPRQEAPERNSPPGDAELGVEESKSDEEEPR
jgi:palmitoyltransferase ZDHHC1/11